MQCTTLSLVQAHLEVVAAVVSVVVVAEIEGDSAEVAVAVTEEDSVAAEVCCCLIVMTCDVLFFCTLTSI